MKLLHGDCLEVLRTLPDNSVDAVVTDPPYGLSFMGKRWDYDVPATDVWAECLRVLKPGGHLLAFAGTRTQHRMAVRIEDAGFEIRDMIAWVYGSGFPKSMDVSKAIDKVRDWTKVEQLNAEIKRAREESGLSIKQVGDAMQAATDGQYGAWYHRGGHMFFETGRSLPSRPEWEHLRRVLPIASEFQDAYNEAERAVITKKIASRSDDGSWASNVGGGMFRPGDREYVITAPATEAARQWQGWGTALKPALEPITVARKPLIGTVAENVLAHGTGAINVDGCRVGTEGGTAKGSKPEGAGNGIYGAGLHGACDIKQLDAGRWPANLIHDGDAAADLLADAARFFYCAKASKRDRDEGLEGFADVTPGEMTNREDGSAGLNNPRAGAGRTGGGKNIHPTVKPTDLMRYLCRLVTPPDGVVLDPFMGSGSTGKAARLEGFDFIGIEREAEYLAIAQARITAAANDNEPQSDLFTARA